MVALLQWVCDLTQLSEDLTPHYLLVFQFFMRSTYVLVCKWKHLQDNKQR